MFNISLDSCEVKENRETALSCVEEINDLAGTLGTVLVCRWMKRSSVF